MSFLKKLSIVHPISLTLNILAIVIGSIKLGGQEVQDIWPQPIKNEIVAKIENKPLDIPRDDISSVIMETIHRRPCTALDLLKILSVDEQRLNKILQKFEAEGTIEIKHQKRGAFYQTVKR